MEPAEVGKYMVMDPRICFGKLTFKGTRVPVQTVLASMAAEARTLDEIRASWPRVKREAVEEAIQLAAVAWPELMRKEVAAALKRRRWRRKVAVGKHMVMHPRVCFGKLTFAGTRVPVQTVLVFMALKGRTMEEILASWEHLQREAIEEAIQLAAVAWPELLRPEVEETIERLAAGLAKRRTSKAKRSREPTRSG